MPFVLHDPEHLYAALGLDARQAASVPSDNAVRDARNEQLQLWHPDRDGGDVERTQRINEAFSRLYTGACGQPAVLLSPLSRVRARRATRR